MRTQFTVKDHNWGSLTYCDFKSYLVVTKLMYKEKLGVCDHKITEIMQSVETSFCINKKLSSNPRIFLRNIIKLLVNIPGL